MKFDILKPLRSNCIHCYRLEKKKIAYTFLSTVMLRPGKSKLQQCKNLDNTIKATQEKATNMLSFEHGWDSKTVSFNTKTHNIF